MGEQRGGDGFAGGAVGNLNYVWSDVGRFFARAVGVSSEWGSCLRAK